MQELTIIKSSYPDGWIIARIARKKHSSCWEFWNKGDIWAGSGQLFLTKKSLLVQLGKLLGKKYA